MQIDRGRGLGLGVALCVWAIGHVATVLTTRAPAAVLRDADPEQFAAERALDRLPRLLEQDFPHPLGSEAQVELGNALLQELRELGLVVSEQETFACGPYRSCGNVRNLAGRLEGRAPGPAVLCVARYDSVPAGAGVADDLSGVLALLEVARALRSGPRPASTVIFLFTDGEESGLLGAQAFANEHPWMDEVGLVLNVEARGTSGPSMMFETGPGSAWLIDAFAGASTRPIANSLSAAVYRRMPNDTDFSVFKARYLPGLNFAFIDDVHNYHTASDDRVQLDLASLQHHGENVLAALRGADGVSRADRPAGEAIYAELFGRLLLRWPAHWALPLALVPLLLFGFAAGRHLRSGRLTWDSLRGGALAALCAVFLPLSVVGLWSAGCALLAGPDFARTFTWPITRLLATTLVVASTVASTSFFGRRTGAAGLAYGAWLGWSLLGLFTALFAPGASYLFLIPAFLVAPCVVVAGPVSRVGVGLASLVGLAWAVPFWSALQIGLEHAFGASNGLLSALPAVALAVWVAPVAWVRGAAAVPIFLALGACAAVLSVLLLFADGASPERPAPLNLVYALDADTRSAHWEVETFGRPLPDSFSELGLSPQTALRPFGDPERPRFAKGAGQYELDAPRFVITQRSVGFDETTVVGRLLPAPGAYESRIILPAGTQLRSASAGAVWIPEPLHAPGPDQPLELTFIDVGPDGIEVALTLAGDAPSSVTVLDRRLGLPRASEGSLTTTQLEGARGERYAALGMGDTTEVWTNVPLD